MRTKTPGETPQDGSAPLSTIEGEKTVIQVDPAEIKQRVPWQLHERPLSLLDVIGFTVLASTALLGGFMAIVFAIDRVRDWLDV